MNAMYELFQEEEEITKAYFEKREALEAEGRQIYGEDYEPFSCHICDPKSSKLWKNSPSTHPGMSKVQIQTLP